MVHAVVHRRSKARGPHQLRWKDFGPGRVSLEDGGPVLEAKKDRKLAFQWSPGSHATTVIFSLDKLGPGTLVNVVESGYCLDRDDLNSLVGCAAGWGEALTLLEFHLEHGVTYGEVPPESIPRPPPQSTSQGPGFIYMDERLKINRTNWNERTPVHAASDSYDVRGFKAGRITLTDIERREVGDVSGKTLLHLQCHFGLDTMSWSRLGAKATGVDFSEDAINLARALNEELALGVRFIRSNIYDLPDALDEQFDIVFTSYGVLNWLPDIARWAEVVSNHLKPAGVFYIVEFHPFAAVFEASEAGDMVPTYRYFYHELFFEGGDPSYAGKGIIETPTYEWQHSLGDIVCALIDAGLRIEFLHEFPFTCYQAYPAMERSDDGWWRLPKHNESFPQMFSIRATR